MEIEPVSYIKITLRNEEGENEIEQFIDFIRRAYIESTRPGLKNVFEPDRAILKKLMEGLRIKVEHDKPAPIAGDTHTSQQFNER